MFTVKPESPLTVEEVLLASKRYRRHFKDADNCSLIPTHTGCRPICIPQNSGPLGLSSEIIEKMLFDAGITDESQYLSLLAEVKAKQQARQDAQTRNIP